MDDGKARLLITSLVDRIEINPESKKRSLPGTISDLEWEALHHALKGLSGDPDPQPPPFTRTQPIPNDLAVQIDRQALQLDRAEDPDVVLCIDFGTAASKAFATVVEGSLIKEFLELGLGRRALEPGSAYAVTSSVWISGDGLAFVGREAVERSLRAGFSAAKRLDSLKQELSMGELRDPEERLVPHEMNPTGIPLTMRDLIILYLGYLTDLAVTELAEEYKRSRYVRRRFALPCWSKERRAHNEEFLRRALAYAQVVADTFHGRWQEGISVAGLKETMDHLNREEPPLHLIGEGVLEPLAAGGSRLQTDDPTRGLVMVVDVGAGTTDFAMFVVREDPDREMFQAHHIKDTARAVRQAGNVLDDILRRAILERADVKRGDAEYQRIDAALQLRLREHKERLFAEGAVEVLLENDATASIELENFLAREEIGRFEETLEKEFQKALASADESFFKAMSHDGLTVVLTGGGAHLPMVRSLAEGRAEIFGEVVRKRRATDTPPLLDGRGEHLVREYPRLAVAIGGADPDLISERSVVSRFGGAAERQWDVGGYYIRGS